jgi:hypothetical protein
MSAGSSRPATHESTAFGSSGFTQRQARFLVVVMLHSGVCMLRQYTAYAGIVHGQKTRAFFSKLVSRKFVETYECEHRRARIDPILAAGCSPLLGEAVARRVGSVEYVVLPHSYNHLAKLAGTA